MSGYCGDFRVVIVVRPKTEDDVRVIAVVNSEADIGAGVEIGPEEEFKG